MAEFNVKQLFDELEDYSDKIFSDELKDFLNNLEDLPQRQVFFKLKEFCGELCSLKKRIDSNWRGYDKLVKVARFEGYFYCNCCNQWEKPLPEEE